MVEAKAKLSYYRLSPRKVRLVAGLIRGKKVDIALSQLKFATKGSSSEISKLLLSAIANAKSNAKLDSTKDLYIKKITVDEGPALKRYRPVSRGMAHSYKKRTSHLMIVLSNEKVEKKEKKNKTDKKTNKGKSDNFKRKIDKNNDK